MPSRERPRYVHGASRARPRYVLGASRARPRYVHGARRGLKSAIILGALVLLFVRPVYPAASQRRLHLVMSESERVFISAGEFRFGLGREDRERSAELCRALRGTPQDAYCGEARLEFEPVVRALHLPAFAIDRHEVSVENWRRCVQAAACPPTHRRGAVADARLPVTHVRADEAEGYCRWRGGRLPSEQEWERAARGPGESDRLFPWGDAYNERLSNHGQAIHQPLRDARTWYLIGDADPIDGYRGPAPVGSFPEGASPDGLLDMAGNVWEWTATVPNDEGDLSLSAFRIIRGGSHSSPPDAVRVTTRAYLPAGESYSDVGFRCAYDPE